MTALVAALEMTAENGGPANLDRMHDAALRDGHRSAVLPTIVVAVAAEDIRHFELRAIHRVPLRNTGVVRASVQRQRAAGADREGW